MELEKFKVGDVVQLNSGGPDMTVASVNTGTVCVVWFYMNHEGQWLTQTDSFSETWLRRM